MHGFQIADYVCVSGSSGLPYRHPAVEGEDCEEQPDRPLCLQISAVINISRDLENMHGHLYARYVYELYPMISFRY